MTSSSFPSSSINSETGEIFTFKPPFLRSPYNYSMDLVSLETGLSCPEPTLAQQHSKDEADINIILERFGQGQALPENFRSPQYGDFTDVTDFHTATQAVREAQESFNSMPAKLRARFHNDPAELMDFLADPDNRVEAAKLGLIDPPATSPAPAPAAAPSTPPGSPANGIPASDKP